MRSKHIAETLSVSVKTVENHRLSIRKKLGLIGKHAKLTTVLLRYEFRGV